MKCVAAVLFLSLQLAGSAFGRLQTTHTEAENAVKERRRNLQDTTPYTKEEKDLFKRMLENKTIRYATDDDKASLGDDPLSSKMRESALSKIKKFNEAETKEADGKQERRGLQNYNYGYGYGYGTYGYGYGYGGGYTGSYGNNQIANTQYVPRTPKADIPDKVSMVLEAFQDSRQLADPIKITPDTSYLDPGTEYLYSNEPVFNVVYDTPPGGNRDVFLVNEMDRIAVVSGSCLRIDPKVNYVGRAYCQFEFRFLDNRGNIEASIMSEGPITKGDINTLSITGGSGIFRRTVGTVVLEAGSLRNGNPPIFIPDDRLDLPSSYMVKMFVFMDSVDLELE